MFSSSSGEAEKIRSGGGCKIVVVRSALYRGQVATTLGKQTNDCGNRRNTKIESNSNHPTIWKEYSKTGPGV